MAHPLRTPKLLKAFCKAIFNRKGGGGAWLVVAYYLESKLFVLEVRSWPGNYIPVNFYQMTVILSPEQKGQSPKV